MWHTCVIYLFPRAIYASSSIKCQFLRVICAMDEMPHCHRHHKLHVVLCMSHICMSMHHNFDYIVQHSKPHMYIHIKMNIVF